MPNVGGSATMPFGPYAGTLIEDLPDFYLYILVERRLWRDLEAAVTAELERRAEIRRERRRAA